MSINTLALCCCPPLEWISTECRTRPLPSRLWLCDGQRRFLLQYDSNHAGSPAWVGLPFGGTFCCGLHVRWISAACVGSGENAAFYLKARCLDHAELVFGPFLVQKSDPLVATYSVPRLKTGLLSCDNTEGCELRLTERREDCLRPETCPIPSGCCTGCYHSPELDEIIINRYGNYFPRLILWPYKPGAAVDSELCPFYGSNFPSCGEFPAQEGYLQGALYFVDEAIPFGGIVRQGLWLTLFFQYGPGLGHHCLAEYEIIQTQSVTLSDSVDPSEDCPNYVAELRLKWQGFRPYIWDCFDWPQTIRLIHRRKIECQIMSCENQPGDSISLGDRLDDLDIDRPPQSSGWQTSSSSEAYWTIIGDWSIRIDFLDSYNCGGPAYGVGYGSATKVVNIYRPYWLKYTMTGLTERESDRFDIGQLLLNGRVIARGSGFGEDQGCAMGLRQIQGAVYLPFPGAYTIEASGNTMDNLFHVGAYWQFDLELLEDPPDDLVDYPPCDGTRLPCEERPCDSALDDAVSDFGKCCPYDCFLITLPGIAEGECSATCVELRRSEFGVIKESNCVYSSTFISRQNASYADCLDKVGAAFLQWIAVLDPVRMAWSLTLVIFDLNQNPLGALLSYESSILTNLYPKAFFLMDSHPVCENWPAVIFVGICGGDPNHGACCARDDSQSILWCLETTREHCLNNLNGTFLGEGTRCLREGCFGCSYAENQGECLGFCPNYILDIRAIAPDPDCASFFDRRYELNRGIYTTKIDGTCDWVMSGPDVVGLITVNPVTRRLSLWLEDSSDPQRRLEAVSASEIDCSQAIIDLTVTSIQTGSECEYGPPVIHARLFNVCAPFY